MYTCDKLLAKDKKGTQHQHLHKLGKEGAELKSIIAGAM